MNYYQISLLDYSKTSWALFEKVKAVPDDTPRGHAQIFRSSKAKYILKPQYRHLLCKTCGRFETDKVLDVGLKEPVEMNFKEDMGLTDDRIFVVNDKCIRVLKDAKVGGYKSKPIGKSGWHVFRVTVFVDTAKGVLKTLGPNCSECKRPKDAGAHIYELNKITPPKQSNTFFTTKFSCASLSYRDRTVYLTEDVLEALKAGQVKGPYCERLWTNEELKMKKEKEKRGETWRPAGMTVYLNGKGSKPAEKKKNTAGQRWFQQYLKSNAKKKPAAVDFAAVEKKRKVKLPQAYEDFISTVGPKSFKDVLETEGFVAKILPPEKMNFRDYRLGKWEDTEEEAEVDGVMFASTDHGDCFVFDVSVKGGDYPVYRYDHETNAMEPWADNFAESIERFVKQI
jgi:hypothetical protein